MRITKTFVCFVAVAAMLAGAASAADTDWDAMSRKAEEAVRAVQAGSRAPSGDKALSYQDVLNDAAAQGRTDVMGWLVDMGADVNKAARDGETPVHAAARSGNSATLRWLRERGANLDARSAAGHTAVHAAVQGANQDTMTWLRGQGFDTPADDAADDVIENWLRQPYKR